METFSRIRRRLVINENYRAANVRSLISDLARILPAMKTDRDREKNVCDDNLHVMVVRLNELGRTTRDAGL